MADIDGRIAELCARGAFDEATTVAIKALAPSVLRYIAARTRDDDLTSEAFALFAEDVWRGLRSFQGRSSVRVWAFVVARNAAAQVMRNRNRDARRARPFSSTLVSQVADQIRTVTEEYLRTDVKERFAALRQRLTPEEQSLLVLRVNERLGWEDIARIQLDQPSDAAVRRESARLRKRFQLVREKLKKMAEAEGLLGNPTEDP